MKEQKIANSSLSHNSFATTAASSSGWRTAKKTDPCILCGKDHWCRMSPDDKAVVCNWTETAPMGWKRVKTSSDGRGVYVHESAISSALPSRPNTNPRPPVSVKTKPPEIKPLLPIDGDIRLYWVNVLTHGVSCTQERGRSKPKVKIVYPYSEERWVERTQWEDSTKPKGYDKKVLPWHKNSEGRSINELGDRTQWLAYRLQEVLESGADGWVIGVEGEDCVEWTRVRLGLLSFTFQGSRWNPENMTPSLQEMKDAGIGGIVYIPDNDKTGADKGKKVQETSESIGLPCIIVPMNQLWSECPDKGDIADWLENASTMNTQDFIRRLEEEIHRAVEQREALLIADIETTITELSQEQQESDEDTEITQIAFEALYGDRPWISFNDKLYYWDSTCYEHSPDAVELRRIRDFCNNYRVLNPMTRQYRYPYAKPASVRQILEWVKISVGVRADEINPPGLNCTNGILQLHWDENKFKPVLVDHSPEFYYIYKPLVKYDPTAATTHCDRLLQALNPKQQEIFLKTIGASLDVSTVRKHKGRSVRALLAKGGGNNGKDTLREVVSLIYGRQGMTGCTLADFAAYDEGRKFPLAKLQHSNVNWASENANVTRLDKLQSLKAFITGDILESERKGQEGEEYNPIAIAIFNVNDTPNLQGTLEAITSRFAVLEFDKTFKENADPSKGEIEADPRFKYDPIFMATMVAPAFLNRVLQALADLMQHGIDYSCTKAALESIQIENCHLFQFCKDTGLQYLPGGNITAGEIWGQLELWYQDNGTLTYDGSKAVWVDQPKPSDKNVKGANQVIARFLTLFPKAKRVTVKRAGVGGKPIQAIAGIGFISKNTDSFSISDVHTPISPNHTPIHTPAIPQKTTQNQASYPTYPTFPSSGEKSTEEKTENHFSSIETTDCSKLQNFDSSAQPKNEEEGAKLGYVGYEPCKSRETGVCSGVCSGVCDELIGVCVPVVENGTSPDLAQQFPVGDRIKVTHRLSPDCGKVLVVRGYNGKFVQAEFLSGSKRGKTHLFLPNEIRLID